MDNAWRLNTWDSFAIPKPLSRVRMIFGPKIYIPRKSSREELESARVGIETLTNDLCDAAESWAHSGEKMLGEQPFTRARRCNSIDFGSSDQKKKAVSKDQNVTPEKAETRSNFLPIIDRVANVA